MKLKRKKTILCILIMCVSMGVMVSTKADNGSEISELEEEISQNEKQYQEIQDQLDKLGDARDNLEQYIVQLNKTYDSMQQMIDSLDSQIVAKNQEIEAVNLQIAEIDNEILKQYESMKLRIQYMYESTSVSYADAFLSSESIGEMLERMQYISSIMEYDRNQMEKYQLNLARNEDLMSGLEAEKEELQSLVSQQQSQADELETMMKEASDNIAAHKEQIAAAEAAAQAIEDEIEAQKNTVEKLKEEEERRKREEEERKRQEALGNVPEKIPYQELDGDIKRMAAIIWCEARGESYEGQVAVGTVVMNRVESPRFPNTIEEVIAQKGQFSPYSSGKYAIALSLTDMQQSCIDAAIEVIRDGKRLGPWLYFRMKNGIINGTFIGCHVFY